MQTTTIHGPADAKPARASLGIPSARAFVRHGGDHMGRPANTVAQFWKRVVIRLPSQCWLYMGALYPKGYGAFRYNGKTSTAHRVSYIVTYGPVASDLVVMHTCDNRRCCNPAHLRVGTPADNVHDMHRKSRAHPPKGENHWTHRHPEWLSCGEHNGSSELRTDDVLSIVLSHRQGVRQRILAERYGVGENHISAICTGRQWASVTGIAWHKVKYARR